MLTTRTALTSAGLALLIVLNTGPAYADGGGEGSGTGSGSGGVTCGESECTINAGKSPGTVTPGGGGQPKTPVGTGHNPGTGQNTSQEPMGLFERIRLYGPQPVLFPGETTPSNLMGLAPENPSPPAGAPPAPPPSPQEVAQVAVSQLRLPSPAIGTSPGGEQIVNVPTWLWIDPASWAPVSATAAVPGVSVTATATPQRVTWTMGDGSTVECAGPGTPYSSRFAPDSASPDCGHTYKRSSASQPGAAFPLEARISWTVTWAGAGQTGVVPGMQTIGQITTRVAEIQAVVVDYRS